MRIADYNIFIRSRLIKIFFVVFAAFVFISCSSESLSQQNDAAKQKGEQTLSFTEKENGVRTHYEVNFEGGEISSIYKDGNKIPDDKVEDYEELVYDKLNYLRKDEFTLQVHPPHHTFHFDLDEFQDKMKEMRKKFKSENFKFKFDREKFKEGMKELNENLKDLDEIVIHIDKDKIRKNLDNSLKHLDELKLHKFNFNFDFDVDEFELNMDKLEEEMERLEFEMDDLSEEMEELDREMKILDKFLEAVKKELVKDNYINNTDEKFELELSSTEMKINNKKVQDDLFKKYKEIYKEHYNKEPGDKIKIHIN